MYANFVLKQVLQGLGKRLLARNDSLFTIGINAININMGRFDFPQRKRNFSTKMFYLENQFFFQVNKFSRAFPGFDLAAVDSNQLQKFLDPSKRRSSHRTNFPLAKKRQKTKSQISSKGLMKEISYKINKKFPVSKTSSKRLKDGFKLQNFRYPKMRRSFGKRRSNVDCLKIEENVNKLNEKTNTVALISSSSIENSKIDSLASVFKMVPLEGTKFVPMKLSPLSPEAGNDNAEVAVDIVESENTLKEKAVFVNLLTIDPFTESISRIYKENIPRMDREEFDASFRRGGMVDTAVLEKLENGFKKLEASDSKSLLKKYLTRDVFDKLKNLKTPTFGSTLLDCIQSGLENHDSGVGIYAPDAEAYSIFAEIFDPIIEDYHGGFKKCDKHPPKDWGDVDSFGNLDPAGEFIISTRVRCGRSLQGYPFNPCLSEAQYKEMEEKMSNTFSTFSNELKGTYFPLTGMTKETQQQLIDDHFLFKEGDRFLQAANACRFWPTGRGIYHNDSKTFLVWVNEEDHLRLISMQMGGDLGQVYRRLVTAVNEIEKKVPFSHHDRLGFLTFCPTNLGTTVRASVHIKVPKLASNKKRLEEVAAKYNLQVRGTRGEHTEAEGGVYDISNKRRMGLTEYQAVKEMNDGITEIIKIEKEL